MASTRTSIELDPPPARTISARASLNGGGKLREREEGLAQRRLELVVILRNDHMTIAHCAISVLQLPCTHGPRNAISYVYTLL